MLYEIAYPYLLLFVSYIILAGLFLRFLLIDKRKTIIIELMALASPLLTFTLFHYFENPLIPSFIVFLFFVVILVYIDRKTPPHEKREVEGSIKVLKFIHKIEDYYKDYFKYQVSIISFAGILSGIPILFIPNRGLTYFLSYFLLISISSFVAIFYFTMRDIEYSSIQVKEGGLFMIRDNRSIVINFSEVEQIRTGRFKVVLERENDELKIWCKSPSKIQNLFVANKI